MSQLTELQKMISAESPDLTIHPLEIGWYYIQYIAYNYELGKYVSRSFVGYGMPSKVIAKAITRDEYVGEIAHSITSIHCIKGK